MILLNPVTLNDIPPTKIRPQSQDVQITGSNFTGGATVIA